LQLAAFVCCARVWIVDEHHVVSNEYAFLQSHAFTDETVAGDFAIGADNRAFLDLDKRSDPRPIAHGATVQVDEVADNDILAESDI
jgi:hypothetical protein